MVGRVVLHDLLVGETRYYLLREEDLALARVLGMARA
jgi:hypothetical protein